MALADTLGAIRARPVAALLELGSLAICFGLVLATVFAIASGPPTGTGGPWLGVIVVGAGFVVFWTALYPLYDRYRA